MKEADRVIELEEEVAHYKSLYENFSKRIGNLHSYISIIEPHPHLMPFEDEKHHERMTHIASALRQIAFGQYKKTKTVWEKL